MSSPEERTHDKEPGYLGKWWARSDSTTRCKPLISLQYRGFEPQRCP
jgi:hypothetical protein